MRFTARLGAGKRAMLGFGALAATIALVCWGALGFAAATPARRGAIKPPLTNDEKRHFAGIVGATVGLENKALEKLRKDEHAAEKLLSSSRHLLFGVIRQLNSRDLGGLDPLSALDRARVDDGRAISYLVRQPKNFRTLAVEAIDDGIGDENNAGMILEEVPTANPLEGCAAQDSSTGAFVEVAQRDATGATGSVSFTFNSATQTKTFTLTSSPEYVSPFTDSAGGTAYITIDDTFNGLRQQIKITLKTSSPPVTNCTPTK